MDNEVFDCIRFAKIAVAESNKGLECIAIS